MNDCGKKITFSLEFPEAVLKIQQSVPGIVAHAWNPSSQETDTGGLL